MSTTQLTEGNLYRIDGKGEALVFSRIGGTGLAILHPPGEPDTQSSCAVEASRLVPVASAPNRHDEIRMASFSLPPGMHCACGANVLRWTDRAEGRATCNGCGEQWVLTGRGGCIEAMAIDPNAWHEAHELAALERLFEIGLAVLRSVGLDRAHVSRNLACRSTSTQQEFTTSLASVAGFDRARIRVEVAHVYRVVAERSAG